MTVPPPPTSAGVPASAQLIYGLFRPECYRTFFVDHNFLDVGCLTLLISKLLSYGIILGALLVKLPQILKIVRSRSTAGLAPSMYILENIGYAIVVAYNVRQGYAFSTFGENVFILIQGLIICVLLVFAERQVQRSRLIALMLGAPLFVCFAIYLAFYCSLENLAWFQTSTIGIFAASRLPQIASNFHLGSTGQLAFVTVLLNSLGSLARVFTTLAEVKDSLVLTGMISGATLNAIMLAQMIFYWNAKGSAATAGGSKASKKKKQAAAAAAAAKEAEEDAWMNATPAKKGGSKGKKGKKQQ